MKGWFEGGEGGGVRENQPMSDSCIHFFLFEGFHYFYYFNSSIAKELSFHKIMNLKKSCMPKKMHAKIMHAKTWCMLKKSCMLKFIHEKVMIVKNFIHSKKKHSCKFFFACNMSCIPKIYDCKKDYSWEKIMQANKVMHAENHPCKKGMHANKS